MWRATAHPEEKNSSGWTGLVILAHVLQPTYPLCSKTAQRQALVSGQSYCHPKSLALGSPLGIYCARERSVLSFSAMLSLFGLIWSLPSVVNPESLKSMLAGLTPVLFVLHCIYFFLLSQCCQFFL